MAEAHPKRVYTAEQSEERMYDVVAMLEQRLGEGFENHKGCVYCGHNVMVRYDEETRVTEFEICTGPNRSELEILNEILRVFDEFKVVPAKPAPKPTRRSPLGGGL